MRRFWRASALSICLAIAPALAWAGSASLSFPGGDFSVPVVSLKEARFQTVIKQQYDYSCGSAVLATLLTYHYDRPTSEAEVFQAMFAAGDQEKVRARGFSMLDMKNYLAARGIGADGFRIGLERVAKAKLPAIVLIDLRGYKHFVLIKGLSDAEIVVGDPAAGVLVYTRQEFEKVLVNDIVFIARTPQLPRFNERRDWAARAKAPFGAAVSLDSLATFTMLLPGRLEF